MRRKLSQIPMSLPFGTQVAVRFGQLAHPWLFWESYTSDELRWELLHSRGSRTLGYSIRQVRNTLDR